LPNKLDLTLRDCYENKPVFVETFIKKILLFFYRFR